MLLELQKQFMDGLLRNNARIDEHLDGQIRSSQQQLSIYRNSYQGGLLKAMIDIYPVCKRLLGDEFFEAMCLRYIKQTPCQSYDINHYGKSFAEFAEQFKPVRELIYLADVIRLEWAWHYAYQADDITSQDFTPLLGFTDSQLESLQLTLTPSMTLLTSLYPVNLIWSANQIEANDDQDSIELDSDPCFLVIWRNGFDSHIDVVEQALFEFLIAIQKNQYLGQVQTINSNFEEHLVTSLKRGYFSSYHY